MRNWTRQISCLLVCLMLFTSFFCMQITDISAAVTPYGKHGSLTVVGADLVDCNGEPFQLRGISTHGINWDVGKPYVNKKAFQSLRDGWGVNAIRLAMYTEEYNGYCSSGNKSELRKLIYKGVKYATELGMYAVIDWHILSDGNPNRHVDEAKKFFKTMAKKYKDQDNVIYEICNEPNGCSWEEIKRYAKKVIKVIRKYDKDAVIIVGTPTWSQLGSDGSSNEVADHPLTGVDNVMYSLHFYASESSHNQYLPAKLRYARQKDIPVIVSEFGLSEANGNGSIDKKAAGQWLKRLDQDHISYFCWSLSNKNESASLLKPGTKKTSGWKNSDLTTAGKFIKKKYTARRKAVD